MTSTKIYLKEILLKLKRCTIKRDFNWKYGLLPICFKTQNSHNCFNILNAYYVEFLITQVKKDHFLKKFNYPEKTSIDILPLYFLLFSSALY